MSTKPFLLGIDQGTSGTKALIIDREGQIHGRGYRTLPRLDPRPGWVEQDPRIVAGTVAGATTQALEQAGCHPADIAAAGLTCQRNTAFAWDGTSGEAIGRAIVWQDLRTVPLLDELKAWPQADQIRHRLGYGPGPYMASLHLAWRMRHDELFREAAKQGRLRLGLSAAWLLQALGRPAGHRLDASLAQSLGLYDIRAGQYWDEWLEWVGVPAAALPTVQPTLDDYGVLTVHDADGRSADVPVRAMIGDQQAALFGRSCRHPGDAECTHGTASYVKLFVGSQPPESHRFDVLCAWNLSGGLESQSYCLEAATTVSGAVLRWMRDALGFYTDYADIEVLARDVVDSGGLYFVPALTGLNAPTFDANARGTVVGLTLGHGRGHIVRAFLEALAYQMGDILAVLEEESGFAIRRLQIGGGISASDQASQIQADILGLPIHRPSFSENTAWAAALLAGLGAATWPDERHLPPLPGDETIFEPQLDESGRAHGYAGWQKALRLARDWGLPGEEK